MEFISIVEEVKQRTLQVRVNRTSWKLLTLLIGLILTPHLSSNGFYSGLKYLQGFSKIFSNCKVFLTFLNICNFENISSLVLPWTMININTYKQRRSDCPVGPALDAGDGVADEEDGGGEGGPRVHQLEQIVTKTQLLRISTTRE